MSQKTPEPLSLAEQWLAAEAKDDQYLLGLLYLKDEMMRVRVDMRETHAPGTELPRNVNDQEIWNLGNQITVRAVTVEYLFEIADGDPDAFASLVAHYERHEAPTDEVEG